jgi:hypothetical protein
VGFGILLLTHWVNISQFQNLIIHPKTSDFPRHEATLVMHYFAKSALSLSRVLGTNNTDC